MSRLIDADLLKQNCKCTGGFNDNFMCVDLITLAKVIDNQPTAFDTEKVVKQLEEVEKIMTSPVNKDCFGEECRASDCTVCLISKAIEIVKGGGNADLLIDRAKSKSGNCIPYDGKWK